MKAAAPSYTIPITLAAGTAGVAPQLSLVYNSQGGNGLVGKGWTLSGLGIINRQLTNPGSRWQGTSN